MWRLTKSTERWERKHDTMKNRENPIANLWSIISWWSWVILLAVCGLLMFAATSTAQVIGPGQVVQGCYTLARQPIVPPVIQQEMVQVWVITDDGGWPCERQSGYLDADPLGSVWVPGGVLYRDQVNQREIPIGEIRRVYLMIEIDE